MTDEALAAAIAGVTWTQSPGYQTGTGWVEPHEYCLFQAAPALHREVSRRLAVRTADPTVFTRVYNTHTYRYLPFGDWVLWKIKHVLNRRPRGAGE
jgi:hypothetical protein